MTTAFATHEQVAAVLRERPAGYEADLMRCAVSRDDNGVTFDVGGDCWRELFKKYRGAYPEDYGRADVAARGRAAWHRLHTEGIGKGADWLADWEKGIPCGECRRKYDALKAVDPPQFPLTPEWGWRIHNAVSAAIGKPSADYADVAPLYGW